MATKITPKDISSLNPELNKIKLALGLTDDLVSVYQSTIAIIEEAIKAGKTNVPMGMLAMVMYADLLHGGAYKEPVEKLPYYSKDPNNQPIIDLPLAAKEAQKEVMFNSNNKHIFPKLLSDQAYFIIKEWADIGMTVDVFKNASTGLSTLVESSGKAARDVQYGSARMMEESAPILKMLAGLPIK